MFSSPVPNVSQTAIAGHRDPHQHVAHDDALGQPAQRHKFDPVIEDADKGGGAAGVVPVDDGVEHRLWHSGLPHLDDIPIISF